MLSTSGMHCAVIGHPVAHSLSPALHRAAYQALGLEWTYSAIDVVPGTVSEFVAGLDEQWRGLSVTMPHKEAIMACGEPDEVVRLSGAANTWVRRQADAIVRNTDVPGFAVACAAVGVPPVSTVTLLGNGATARSALIAVAQMGARQVTVVARDVHRAEPLVELGTRLGLVVVTIGTDAQLPEADLAVSTVPVAGSEPLAAALARRSAVLFDAVYDPWPTPLAIAGERAGRQVLNGLDLLAGQAVDQLWWMTDQRVEFDLLRRAAQQAIDSRH